jgi:hypothetical protein
VRGISGLPARHGVILAVAALAASMAAGGAAVALTTSPSSHVVSMSAAGRTSAALKITAGTPVLSISVGKLGGTLLQVSTPDDAPVRPVLSGSELILLSLAGAAPASGQGQGSAGQSQGHGPGAAGYVVKVVLNSAVTWSLDLAGGTQRTEIDLRGGKVGGIAVTAGTDVLDVSLPKPAGTLPILLADGASQVVLSLPAGVPAQVTAGGGAAFVSVDNQNLTGVAGGTVLTSPGWAAATSRLYFDATSGFSSLTISRWQPAGS